MLAGQGLYAEHQSPDWQLQSTASTFANILNALTQYNINGNRVGHRRNDNVFVGGKLVQQRRQ